MVGVDSPYSRTSRSRQRRDRAARARCSGARPCSEQESLPTVSSLGSWNGFLATCERRSSKWSDVTLALGTPPNYATFQLVVVLTRSDRTPVPGAGQIFAGYPTGTTVRLLDFPEISSSHSGRPRVVQPSRRDSIAAGSCALRPEHLEYIATACFAQAILWPEKKLAKISVAGEWVGWRCVRQGCPESHRAISPPRKMALRPLQGQSLAS